MKQKIVIGEANGGEAHIMITVQIVRCDAGAHAGRKLETFFMEKAIEAVKGKHVVQTK